MNKMKAVYITAIIIFILVGSKLLLDDLTTKVPKNDFNIVLITIDTLRADHLSCYGYERNTSPHIDSIARQGILFKRAIAPSPWTAPSMASLTTSLYPSGHGMVHGIGDTISEQEILSEDITTLAEILQKNGYRTFGVLSNSHLHEKNGFGRGYDYFKCLPFMPASFVHETIDSWADAIKTSEKYFLRVHYFDPHWPYWPHQPRVSCNYLDEMPDRDEDFERNMFKQFASKKHHEILPVLQENHPRALFILKALYDSEISHVDSYVGSLIEQFHLNTNTLIIITSDHGEEFLEHGNIGHGNNLHRESLRVPLIIKLPHKTSGTTVKKPVSLIDIMPTILHLLNIPPPEQTAGTSLVANYVMRVLSFIRGKPAYRFAELDLGNPRKALIAPEWKYIYDFKHRTGRIYNISSDPTELNNLIQTETAQKKHLQERLLNWVSSTRKFQPAKLSRQFSPEEKEKLKALGYVQ